MAWKVELQEICGAQPVRHPQRPHHRHDPGNLLHLFLFRGHSNIQRILDDGLFHYLHEFPSILTGHRRRLLHVGGHEVSNPLLHFAEGPSSLDEDIPDMDVEVNLLGVRDNARIRDTLRQRFIHKHRDDYVQCTDYLRDPERILRGAQDQLQDGYQLHLHFHHLLHVHCLVQELLRYQLHHMALPFQSSRHCCRKLGPSAHLKNHLRLY